MDFDLTYEQQAMADTALDVAQKYGPDYWYEKDEQQSFPREFIDEIGELGFFGLPIPEAYGGVGTGLTEMALVMEAMCRGGGGGGPALGYLFGALGAVSILAHGNEAQKQHYLPLVAQGKLMVAFGLSEPDAGTNSLNIRTFAQRHGDDYVINGNKWFNTNFEESGAIMLVTRTTKKEAVKNKAEGISMFLVDLPAKGISASPTPKHGFNYYKSYDLAIEELRVSKNCLMGEEGRGFYNMLGTLNPERILVAAGAIGTGRIAIRHAVDYAKERQVFGQPIGAHQAVQHPLAVAYAKLETAWLAVIKAAAMHDQGKSAKDVGDLANMAKYLSVEASIEAVHSAMQTLGGAGFAKEYHIERWWREVQLFRLAPITQQMTLNYLGEHVLGLPRSY